MGAIVVAHETGYARNNGRASSEAEVGGSPGFAIAFGVFARGHTTIEREKRERCAARLTATPSACAHAAATGFQVAAEIDGFTDGGGRVGGAGGCCRQKQARRLVSLGLWSLRERREGRKPAGDEGKRCAIDKDCARLHVTVQARAKNGLRELAFVVLLSAARRAASYAYTAFGERCLGRIGQGPSSAGKKKVEIS